ncbi:XRE family transcriptional regulator, partial [Listeria monocytogenes]|nr:XRE family transcriptional regulator [Listeria monocytogenes]
MKISLGAVITEKRKEKKVTQQELADFVGVSKAAVSKWETGQTYPDITLLPLLAAYFDVSIDSLLDYEPELNQQEIQRIYLSLQKSFQTKSAEEVLQSIESFIHRYYSCYPFLLQMGNLLLNHYDLLPGENPLEKQQRYIPKALDLFIRVRSNSKEVALMDEAMKMQAYCLLILNRPDDVLAILGEYVPPYLPSDSLIAGAFQLKGATDQALATTQSGIFQNLFVLLSGLTNY